MADDPYRYFRLEARDILDQLSAAMLRLERDADARSVPLLLRLTHTLKGAARVVKQDAIADAAHAIEEVLASSRDGAAMVPPDGLGRLRQHLDVIAGRVRALEAERPAAAAAAAGDPAATAAPEPAEDDPIRSVRAEIAELDAVLDGIAETHALLNRLRTTQRRVEEARALAGLLAQQAAHPPAGGDRSAQLAIDLQDCVGDVERGLAATVDEMHRELGQLRGAAEQVRLVGAATLIAALERTARDAAQALAKQIVFTASGGDIRIDADVVVTAQRALVQIVRNAVAHGIEAPAERLAAGKPAAGQVALTIARRGDRLVFACRDDGRGIDLAAVRRAARRRGVALGPLETADLTTLLLHGGISTAEQVSEIAGRGVGLEIVRGAASRLGGTVAVTTEPGRGTRFELAVPLARAAIAVLPCDAGGTVVALPLDAIRGALLVGADGLTAAAGGATILYEHAAVPFLWLPGRLAGVPPPSGRSWPGIVIAGAGGMAAIGVSRLLGPTRVVVRPLPALAPAAPIVAGAFLDADGNPQLVLSPDALIAEARRQDAVAAPPAPPPRRPILVVDDSPTTRMLEQSILESAGYEVDLAVSAEEALAIARQRQYALFLVDVEMPGMDGFTFVERTRSDPLLRDVPAVLVTSRAAAQDRRRGREVGACGYIVKGEFDQAELLATIRAQVGA